MSLIYIGRFAHVSLLCRLGIPTSTTEELAEVRLLFVEALTADTSSLPMDTIKMSVNIGAQYSDRERD